MAANMDPFGMQMDGNAAVSFFGQNQTVDMKMYAVTNEDGSTRYLRLFKRLRYR